MSRLGRARLWLGAASVGAVVFAASLAAVVRSCSHVCHGGSLTGLPSFETLRCQLAEIQRSRRAPSHPR